MEHLLRVSNLATPRSPNTITAVDLQRAWHLLSLLLSTGGPLPPLSLSSLCRLFPAAPDYVTYLCSIPNSPILLTVDLLVAPSVVAFRALHNFVSDNCGSVRRIELGGFRFMRNYQKKRKMDELEFAKIPVLKRSLILPELDENEENHHGGILTCRASSNCNKVLLPRKDYINKGVDKKARILNSDSNKVYRIVKRATCSPDLSNEQLDYGTNNINLANCKHSSSFEYSWEHEHAQSSNYQNSFLNVRNSLNIPDLGILRNTEMCMPYLEHFKQRTPVQESIAWRETKISETFSEQKTMLNATTFMEREETSKDSLAEAVNISQAFRDNNAGAVEDEAIDNIKTEFFLAEITMYNTFNAVTFMDLEEEIRVPPVDTNNVEAAEEEAGDNFKIEKNLVEKLGYEGKFAGPAINNDEMVYGHETNQKNINLCIDVNSFKDGVIPTARVDNNNSFAKYKSPVHHNQPSETSARTKTFKRNAPRQQCQRDLFGNKREIISPSEEMQRARNKITISMKPKVKKTHEGRMPSKKEHDNFKEGQEKPNDIALKNQQKPKPLPNFELYTVEEEEGSGGYGTVYRARRKSDGVTFAIKCPHENANKHHVDNELKMLERFGGKNLVIKYEGSFKCADSECLVLEHVQHDRPEILKRQIEVSQLMWYGFCMFRALAALHKQGIVHRDVKPGNFLFSRKANQGFLIDFNLAMDLHQKCGTGEKSKVSNNVRSNDVPPVQAKALPLANKKYPVNKPTESTSKNLKSSKPQTVHNTQKRNVVGAKNAFSGQGADGSGVTSVKDGTSTRIPSGEKSKELILCHSTRKALVTFFHQGIQNEKNEAGIIPVSKRKRVSAPEKVDHKKEKMANKIEKVANKNEKVDNKNVCITPMPLFSNGFEVAGSGRIKDEEEKKQKREGPCVGTKGFRAPEVLIRSAHQGPKIDVWSAGVTLLYLMIGRTPFTGDPEQNIKDIAKLRGSEDLWEIAKLHNRVSSFPQELHDIQFLSSVKLRDWCKQITRKPEFFSEIPMSLFDLVDKCLTVNPRLRLSAEEAFRHEFFTSCRVGQRRPSLKKESKSDSGTPSLLQK